MKAPRLGRRALLSFAYQGSFDGPLDGMIMPGKTLYIVTPYDFVPDPVDRVQVLQLSDDVLSAKRVKTFTDWPDR